jgi:hypothetical protein
MSSERENYSHLPKSDDKSDETSKLITEDVVNGTHNADYGAVAQANDAASCETSFADGSNATGCSVVAIYKRRWYILLVFSLLNIAQNAVWNTWNPLSQSVQIAFGWTLSDIALLTNWGCITYVISMPFFSWLMDVKG